MTSSERRDERSKFEKRIKNIELTLIIFFLEVLKFVSLV